LVADETYHTNDSRLSLTTGIDQLACFLGPSGRAMPGQQPNEMWQEHWLVSLVSRRPTLFRSVLRCRLSRRLPPAAVDRLDDSMPLQSPRETSTIGSDLSCEAESRKGRARERPVGDGGGLDRRWGVVARQAGRAVSCRSLILHSALARSANGPAGSHHGRIQFPFRPLLLFAFAHATPYTLLEKKKKIPTRAQTKIPIPVDHASCSVRRPSSVLQPTNKHHKQQTC